MMKTPVLYLLSAIAIAAAPAIAQAGAAPEDAIATLQKRGYSSIEIKPDDSPGYTAKACKGGTRFDITMDRQINIIDVDPRGSCGKQEREVASAAPPPPPPQGDGGYEEGYKGEYYGQAEPPPPPPGPAYAHAPVFDELYARGYYDIRVIDRDDDEMEVLACKAGRLYEIEIKYNGRIDDIDRKGRCRWQGRSGKYGAHVEAPFASVDTYKGNVDVEAPFAGVHVDRGSVYVRAPFVDLRIPKW